MSGDSGSTNTNQTTTPWIGVQDPMLDAVSAAGALYSQPYQAYQGQTVAGPADSTVLGQNLAYQRASLGAPDLNAARGAATDYSSGAFMDSNPYVQQNSDWTRQVMADNARNMANAYATGTAANTDAMFARSGAFGGSAHLQNAQQNAAGLANAVGQMGNQYNMQRSTLGSGSYQQDTANRLQAMGLAGSLSQDDWKSADVMRQQGLDQSGYLQKLLDDAQGKYNAEMNYPSAAMDKYAQLIAQFGGMGSQTTSSLYGGGNSALGTGISAGLLGLAGYNALKP